MKQYFICPNCKKRLIKSGREQYMCKKCKALYRVPNYQRITALMFNAVIIVGIILGISVALNR